MPEFSEPSAVEDMPANSLEMDAISLWVEAFILAFGPKKGRQLLVAAQKIMEQREARAEVILEFLPPTEAAAKASIRRQTRAWFRSRLPVWIRRLDKV